MTVATAEIHEAILAGVVSLFLANILVLGVVLFQHRLMWKEYAKRHKMNGDDKVAE